MFTVQTRDRDDVTGDGGYGGRDNDNYGDDNGYNIIIFNSCGC